MFCHGCLRVRGYEVPLRSLVLGTLGGSWWMGGDTNYAQSSMLPPRIRPCDRVPAKLPPLSCLRSPVGEGVTGWPAKRASAAKSAAGKEPMRSARRTMCLTCWTATLLASPHQLPRPVSARSWPCFVWLQLGQASTVRRMAAVLATAGVPRLRLRPTDNAQDFPHELPRKPSGCVGVVVCPRGLDIAT